MSFVNNLFLVSLGFVSTYTVGANHKTLVSIITKSGLYGAKVKVKLLDEYFVGQEDVFSN